MSIKKTLSRETREFLLNCLTTEAASHKVSDLVRWVNGIERRVTMLAANPPTPKPTLKQTVAQVEAVRDAAKKLLEQMDVYPALVPEMQWLGRANNLHLDGWGLRSNLVQLVEVSELVLADETCSDMDSIQPQRGAKSATFKPVVDALLSRMAEAGVTITSGEKGKAVLACEKVFHDLGLGISDARYLVRVWIREHQKN